MIVDAHSHLQKRPDYKSIERIINSKLVDQVWIMEAMPSSSPGSWASHQEMLKVKKDFSPFFKMFPYLDFYSSPDEIKRLKDMGFDGLKSINPGKPYNHPDWFPFYEVAEKERMPILFHTGTVANPSIPVDREFFAKYSPDADYMRPIYMDVIAKLFPDIVLIIGHCGQKLWRDEAFDMLYNHKNVYADLSGSMNTRDIEDFNMYVNKYTYYDSSILISEKLLFGVDSRHYGGEYANVYERVRKTREFWENFLAYYGADKPWGKDKDKIMGETARKLLL